MFTGGVAHRAEGVIEQMGLNVSSPIYFQEGVTQTSHIIRAYNLLRHFSPLLEIMNTLQGAFRQDGLAPCVLVCEPYS